MDHARLTPADSNVAIRLTIAPAARTSGIASAAADPSPNRSSRSRSGFEIEPLQDERMSGSGDRVAAICAPPAGREPDGHERGGTRDEPVEEDRHPAGRGAEDHAGERGDLQAAHRGERAGGIDGSVPRPEPVRREGRVHHLGLARDARVVEARARAADRRRRRG